MKKILLALLMCVGLVTGCSDFDKKDVEVAAKEIVLMVDRDQMEEIYDNKFSQTLLDETDKTAFMESFVEMREKNGPFVEFKTCVVELHDDNAVCNMTALYENGYIQYQISFNKNMQIEGFYFR